ncbi:MAG: hypothetical protein IJR54_01945 [Oscillibacter sp.]|nr:hypothetical protein [Oscillibacter sp.]
MDDAVKKEALIISYFGWYERRIAPIRELLLPKYHVTVLLSDYDHLKKAYRTERESACVYLHVPPYRKNISVRRILSHLFFGLSVSREIDRLQPDLIYLLMPPNNTAAFCLRYRKRHPECLYYVDLIDMWPESLLSRRFKNSPPARLWSKMRDESVGAADHVFTECDFYRDALASVIGDPERATTLHLFLNQTDEEYAIVLRQVEESQRAEKRLRLAYLGSINHIIDIEGICNVTTALIQRGYTVEVRIIGDGENRELLLERLRESGAEVRYFGKIFDQKEKIKLLGSCDYGFNMMKQEVSVGLTIKSLDYLSMGIPLINNIPGDTWNFVKRDGIGVNVDASAECVVEKLERPIDRNAVLKFFRRTFSRDGFQQKAAEHMTT